jgi:hypothetical protein
VDQAKVFRVTYIPAFNSTVMVSWDRIASGMEQEVQMLSAHCLLTLWQRSLAIDTTLFKVWYLAQILPLLPGPAAASAKVPEISSSKAALSD